MGKMHIGLGGFTYLLGFGASVISLNSQHTNWQQATRNGNRTAQSSAALATLGAGGMTAINTYGLGHTVHAGYAVLMAKNSAARTAAWAAAGTRLSTVFFRFNLAGALFTALELGGTWPICFTRLMHTSVKTNMIPGLKTCCSKPRRATFIWFYQGSTSVISSRP